MLLSRFARFAATGLLLVAAANMLYAQSSRIAGVADASKKVALTGNISPRLAKARDLGAAEGARQLPSMSLRFSMTPVQQAALTQLLADQQNPASPHYHQWLSPEQFRVRFGLSDTDLATVASWLAQQGFQVTEVSRGGLFVRFNGTVAQAEQAFQTQIHTVSMNGEQHIANITAPQLPAAIAAVTQGITGLDDFRPKPHHREAYISGANGPIARPQYTTSAGVHYLAPGDFYTIYDEKPLLTNNVNGSGVTVAIVGQTDIYPADIAAFQGASGLANKPASQALYGTDPGYPSLGDLDEAEMDLEWAGAIAPGATILYVNSVSVIDGSLTGAIDNDVAPIVATSYGECEADIGTNALAYYSQLLQMGSAEGMTITAASGDSGATDCDVNVGSAVAGLAVDFPASSPLVTGIGGTTLTEGSGSYWSTTNGANASSATSYIPEVAWNDNNGAGLDATGGGASDYFSKPTWQIGTGVPSDYSRDVPDVSLAASIIHDGYLICAGITNCTSGFSNASSGFTVSGGTSVGAPAFAALLALVEQKTGGLPLGNANPAIYALANSTYNTSVFHDITSGTNASPCAQGSVDCPAGGTIGFAAKSGYDQATGWGSVDAANLVNDWALVTPAPVTGGVDPSVTNIAGSATTATVGTAITFTVTVASGTTASTATPTGTAQITVDSVPVGSPIALTAGTGTYSLATTGLSTGSHVVQATYTGDSTFAGSKGAFAITITAAVSADFTLTPSITSVTVASGTIAPAVVFTVAAQNGFTGSIAFADSVTTPMEAQYSFSMTPLVLTSTTTSASTSFSLLAYTNNTTAMAHPQSSGWFGAGSGVALAGLVLLILPRRRRLSALLVVLLSAGAIEVLGCGSGTPTATSTITGTPAGTYSVLITATSTNNGVTSTHTQAITYIVQ
jgi:subtilase family serine protease